MPTLRSLVSRSDLRLRFLIDEDGHRYGGRSVRGVVRADWTVDELAGSEGARGLQALHDFLVLAWPGPSGWDTDPEHAERLLSRLADAGVAGVVLNLDSEHAQSFSQSWAKVAERHGLPLLAVPDSGLTAHLRLSAAIEDELRREYHQSTESLRDMQRQVGRREGLRHLLRQLSRRVDGYVVLVDRSGQAQAASPRVPEELLWQVRHEIRQVAAGRIRSASVGAAGHEVQILSIGDEEPTAVLVVVKDKPFTPYARRLVGDAAGLIWVRWRLDELGRREGQIEAADRHNREAVLHLLMVGHLSGARRAAGALGSPLADVVRVYVVECPEAARDEVVARCDEALDGQGWIVRCPAYTRHVIVLAPVAADQEDAEDPLDRALRNFVQRKREVCIGAGHSVPLHETATGWEYAFHALAVARASDERFARFNPRGSLAELLGDAGHGWAMARLRPLLEYRADRPQDPDASELTETLRSWLAFYNTAAKQLKIHRNTLSARLRRIERLLDCDLSDLDAQTELYLALRILSLRPGNAPDGAATLDELLDSDAVRDWADAQLHPLFEQDSSLLLDTLRCWLGNNASLGRTAMSLGISVPGVRKRLVRVEEIIERSLLAGPSARYDLRLALRCR